MSEYWKSNARHYCEVCKIWLSGHERNIAAHEQSKQHQGRKDRVLQDLEINQRKKAKEKNDLTAEIHAIEAAAQAAMKKDILNDPMAMAHLNLNRLNRYIPMSLPSRSVGETVARPIEEVQIAEYIAKATGRKVEVQSTVFDEDDFRKTLIYFSDEKAVPSHMRDAPTFRNKSLWVESSDVSTGLPLWTHKGFNIALWEEPTLPPELQEEKPSKGGGQPANASVPQKSMEAPMPGEWKPVPISQSVFFAKEGTVVPTPAETSNAESRLDEFLACDDQRSDRVIGMSTVLADDDLVPVERLQYTNKRKTAPFDDTLKTKEEPIKAGGLFKKRKIPAVKDPEVKTEPLATPTAS